MRFIQNEPFHATQPMERGVFTSHDGGVRGQRERGLRCRMSEDDTPGGKGVEVRRLGSLKTPSGRRWTGITTQVISTCCVERDQEDIAVWQRGAGVGGSFAPPASYR